MRYNILSYGAVADGVTLNSAAIQAAIDDCAAHGGGRVVIPTGVFKSGTIWLKSNVELHLEMGATLLGSENIHDYNDDDAYPQNWGSKHEKWRAKHLIIGLEIENAAITGLGVINSSGTSYFTGELGHSFHPYIRRHGHCIVKDELETRPGQMIAFVESKRIHVENITLMDAPCWSLFFNGCEFVTVKGLKVRNPRTSLNTDGIDIDCCRYVTVSDCLIDTGDDCIAIRCDGELLKHQTPCEYITITNCNFAASACAFRIGVGVGEIQHVRISNITIECAEHVALLQTSYNGSGCAKMRDINISNVSATGVDYGLEIFSANNAYVKDITFSNIRVEAHAASDFICAEDGEMENVTLRDIEITLSERLPRPLTEEQIAYRGGHHGFCIKGGKHFRLENVRVHGELDQCDVLAYAEEASLDWKRDCNF